MPAHNLGLGAAAPAILAAPDAPLTHAPFPSGTNTRLLVPRRPVAAAVTSLRRYTAPGTRLTRMARLGAVVAARMGGTQFVPNAVALGGVGTFLEYIIETLDRGALVYSIHLGPPRANRKPVVHLMTPRGHSVAYVKLGINELTCSRVRQEAEAIRHVSDAATPGLVTPTLIDAGEWEGLAYLVIDPLDTDAARIPGERLREAACDALVAAFPVSTYALVDSPWWVRAMRELALCTESNERNRLQRAADRLIHRYGDLAIAVGAAHGDWSRWNMSVGGAGVMVWDWERFATDVPLGWDELHFRLSSHPGGPAVALSGAERTLRVGGKPLPDSHAQPLLVAYLICRGISRLKGQQDTGVENAALGGWLLPSLEDVLADAESATT